MEVVSFKVTPEFHGWRLDLWLLCCLQCRPDDSIENNLSRTQLQQWIKAGYVSNPTRTKIRANQHIQSEEEYVLSLNSAIFTEPLLLIPNFELELTIVYEDDDILVIHKPTGIAVHPGPSQHSNSAATIANALLALWQKKGLWKDETERQEEIAYRETNMRPGIAHRLDKDTEGLLLVAKHRTAQEKLMKLFQEHKIHKEYMAWVWGTLPENTDTIDLPIARHPFQRFKMRVDKNGRDAITQYRTLQVFITREGRKFSQIVLQPITGRTHQLRVHLTHFKCPVVGDKLYSHSKWRENDFGMLLFANRLQFLQPCSGKPIDLKLELPKRFIRFEELCQSKYSCAYKAM